MMKRHALAVLGLAVLAASACADPVSPAGRTVRSGPSATLVTPPPCTTGCGGSTGGGGTTTPFTVTVQGPDYVTTASNVVYSAQTTGGSGTLTYAWSEYVCYGSAGTTCQSINITSNGMWYIHHSIGSTVCTDEMIVLVTDGNGSTVRGSKVTSGPACLL